MKNKVQLITYVDRLHCADILGLKDLIQNKFKDLFGGIHILPFFYPYDGEDAGFDPIDHTIVDPKLGDWDQIRELSKSVDIMADMIVNHVSVQSDQFKDYLDKGENSEYSAKFLTYDKIFDKGATEAELTKIYRPRPGLPFTKIKLHDGSEKLIWTTFTSNQIDIDVRSQVGEKYLDTILNTFNDAGITMIRLDAAGYAIKKKGSSCFMIDETFDFIADLTKKAKKSGIFVLVEIHSYYQKQIEIAKKVDYVYDFALPVLVLDTIFNKKPSNLKKWLEISPRNAFTVLDTHDGIGIIDVASEEGKPGLIEDDVLDKIVKKIHKNSEGRSLKATGAAASNLDLYQVNCTFYEALAKDDKHYLMARAIQFFCPGIPQVYYVGLLAGENDMDLLSQTQVGRDINRHYYSAAEIDEHLERDIVKDLITLIKFRNTHPSFQGNFRLIDCPEKELNIKWENGEYWSHLKIDLKKNKLSILCNDRDGNGVSLDFITFSK